MTPSERRERWKEDNPEYVERITRKIKRMFKADYNPLEELLVDEENEEVKRVE